MNDTSERITFLRGNGGKYLPCIVDDNGRWWHLNQNGEWTLDGAWDKDWHPTEAAAREFARQHAEPADAGGRELPDAPGLWIREAEGQKEEFQVLVKEWQTGELLWSGWDGRYRDRGHVDHLPRGNWHTAPSDTADLRAEVERLREKNTDLQNRLVGLDLHSQADYDTMAARAEAAEAKAADRERAHEAAKRLCLKTAQERNELRAERDTLAAKLAAAEAERDEKAEEINLLRATLSQMAFPKPPTAAPRQE